MLELTTINTSIYGPLPTCQVLYVFYLTQFSQSSLKKILFSIPPLQRRVRKVRYRNEPKVTQPITKGTAGT